MSAFAFLSNVHSQTTMTIMDSVIFYDGYAGVVNQPTPANVFRLRNDLVTKKLTATEIDAIGSELTINIVISALCDNYDRIGNVNLAMVTKGSTSYSTDSVPKIEIGRYITPFMNKNVSPTSVPYSFVVNNIAKILKSSELNAQYDFWLEFEVFGVPYAANQQVAGCSGRNDVFKGKIDFVTNGPTSYDPQTLVLPLSFKAYLNNYQAGASDAIGTTVKTITFNTSEIAYGAKLYLITSNHGANNNGEEYVRRQHYVEFDGTQVLSYLPGGKSCEPYRMYNTQGNGIYGSTAHTESWWTAWNNWCPGDVIPIREINLGTLQAGMHTFILSVPDAQFADGQGYFPVSLYLQGSKTSVASINELDEGKVRIYPNPSSEKISISSDKLISKVTLTNVSGQHIQVSNESILNISSFENGLYMVEVAFEDGTSVMKSFVKN